MSATARPAKGPAIASISEIPALADEIPTDEQQSQRAVSSRASRGERPPVEIEAGMEDPDRGHRGHRRARRPSAAHRDIGVNSATREKIAFCRAIDDRQSTPSPTVVG